VNVMHNSAIVNDVQKGKIYEQPSVQSRDVNATGNFRQILEETVEKSARLQFSKHAGLRLAARNINLSEDQIERVENGMLKAKEKGIRDSLVMVDDVALVVNVLSKTVITAIGNNSQNVFTNIDGAVIV